MRDEGVRFGNEMDKGVTGLGCRGWGVVDIDPIDISRSMLDIRNLILFISSPLHENRHRL